MEEERIAYQVFNTLCSLTQPDRDTVAAHQIPLVTFFCVSVYGGPARGIGTDLERFRIKIPDYFFLSTYEKMSALLDEIIAARKAKAIEYEDYLQRIAALAKQVEAGQADDTPEALKKSPALRALYNNLRKHDEQPEGLEGAAEERTEYIVPADPMLHLALQID